jgi:hypothetical protein
MTNQEINEAVASKLGWRVAHGLGCMGVGTLITKPDGTISMTDVPDYCTDISAAWEIVIKSFKSFYLFWDKCTDTWFCKWDNQRRPMEGCRYTAEADTAPMAICLAFLKLK